MRRLAIAVAAVLMIGCGGSDSGTTAPPAVTVVGVYQLKTVNGTALPYTSAQSASVKTEITADQISLNADGTFSEITNYRITQGVSVTTTAGGGIGVYSHAGGAVQITYTTGGTGTLGGNVSGNTLTILVGAGSWVFTK